MMNPKEEASWTDKEKETLLDIVKLYKLNWNLIVFRLQSVLQRIVTEQEVQQLYQNILIENRKTSNTPSSSKETTVLAAPPQDTECTESNNEDVVASNEQTVTENINLIASTKEKPTLEDNQSDGHLQQNNDQIKISDNYILAEPPGNETVLREEHTNTNSFEEPTTTQDNNNNDDELDIDDTLMDYNTTKEFDLFTATCNKETPGTAKVKNHLLAWGLSSSSSSSSSSENENESFDDESNEKLQTSTSPDSLLHTENAKRKGCVQTAIQRRQQQKITKDAVTQRKSKSKQRKEVEGSKEMSTGIAQNDHNIYLVQGSRPCFNVGTRYYYSKLNLVMKDQNYPEWSNDLYKLIRQEISMRDVFLKKNKEWINITNDDSNLMDEVRRTWISILNTNIRTERLRKQKPISVDELSDDEI